MKSCGSIILNKNVVLLKINVFQMLTWIYQIAWNLLNLINRTLNALCKFRTAFIKNVEQALDLVSHNSSETGCINS